MIPLLRPLVIVVVGLLVCGTATAPAASATRHRTWVGGWTTSLVTVSSGHAVGTRIRVRSGGRAWPRRVVLQHRRWGGHWRVLNRLLTGRDGRALVRGVPPASGQLRVFVPATRRARATFTAARNVRVRKPDSSQRATRLEARVRTLVNELRGRGTTCAGKWYPAVPPVRHRGKLATASRTYARRMAVHDFFSHRDLITGKGPGWRATNAGYSWSAVGENIGAGYDTPAAVVRAWRKSAGHCKNMMDARWKHLGVGWHDGGSSSRWGHYWVQLFGVPG